MNIDKYTIKGQEAIQAAVRRAQNGGQQAIEPEHLLAGVFEAGENVVQFIFSKLGANAQQLKGVLESQLRSLPRVSGGQPYLSQTANEVLNQAEAIASKAGDEFVGIEAMLQALLEVKSTVSGLLKDAGFTRETLERAVKELRGGSRVNSQTAEDTYQALSKYARDLVKDAREGKLDPVIGRDDEIRRVLQILSRRTKNNPVLIGEPGTGKTAIVEGLAERIMKGDVPETLKDKQLFSLDMGRTHHPLHRRNPHAGGCRQGRRGHGRRQHSETGPQPRRDTHHRRHHPRRIPEIFREGQGTGTPVPDCHGR